MAHEFHLVCFFGRPRLESCSSDIDIRAKIGWAACLGINNPFVSLLKRITGRVIPPLKRDHTVYPVKPQRRRRALLYSCLTLSELCATLREILHSLVVIDFEMARTSVTHSYAEKDHCFPLKPSPPDAILTPLN